MMLFLKFQESKTYLLTTWSASSIFKFQKIEILDRLSCEYVASCNLVHVEYWYNTHVTKYMYNIGIIIPTHIALNSAGLLADHVR